MTKLYHMNGSSWKGRPNFGEKPNETVTNYYIGFEPTKYYFLWQFQGLILCIIWTWFSAKLDWLHPKIARFLMKLMKQSSLGWLPPTPQWHTYNFTQIHKPSSLIHGCESYWVAECSFFWKSFLMRWGTKSDTVTTCLDICANQHSSNLLSTAWSHAHPYQVLYFQTRKCIDALLLFFLLPSCGSPQ